jgi:alginate O-acetyltransferase complex protein AlgI
MSFLEIAVLVLFSLVLGAASQRWQRQNLLLVSSLLLLYWLQPETPLRFSGFWLPTAAVFLVILSWTFTAAPEVRKNASNFRTLALVFVIIIALGLARPLDARGLLGFVLSPPLGQLLPGILAAALLVTLLLVANPKSSMLTWIGFSLIISIFIILKTPSLAAGVSRAWRLLSGQSTALVSASDISWLGYSYLAFRLLHTIRDRQAGRLSDYSLKEYLTYVILFPSLVSGPITQIDQVVNDLRQSSHHFRDNISGGSERILMGLFKKFVIADSLSIMALNNFNSDLPTTALGAWILLYAYAFQIYFDFSGYTDIAIGMGKFLDIKLPENFNRPYLRTNLTQFWNNWHISLTNWFRSYFFNPLSRSLRRKKLPLLTILTLTQIPTMVLVGLWHGITPNFIIWGLWHGLGLLIQNRWSAFSAARFPQEQGGISKKILHVLGIFLTFHYVTLGWIWFVLPTPEAGWHYFLSLLGAA